MAAPPDPTKDLIVVADRIHLLGDRPPVTALLVRAGRVVAAGKEGEVRAAALPGARKERLPLGSVITPGLTDAHVHLSTWALARRQVNLHDARTLEEGLEAVRRFAAASPGTGWVRGAGWDANRWGAEPTAEALDRVLPDRPAYLESKDIHSVWLNSAALRLCGITRGTADPDGGQVVRDGAGEPAGVLKETAKRLAEAHLPAPSEEEMREALLDAQRETHRLGLTGVHSVETDGLAHWTDLLNRGLLRLRVLQTIPVARLDAAIEVGLRSGLGGEWLKVGGVKMFLDGALGSRTAWMRAPYEGAPENTGISTFPPEEFRETVRRAAAAGIASTVHAIGDRAVELAIDVLGAAPRVGAVPHRIEHVQLCPPDLWERAGASGVVGSVQPIHLMTDIPAAERHWGRERSRGAYPFAALLGAGMTLAFGSDVPVESCDPRLGLYAASCRKGWDGEPAEEWFPEHCVPVETALRAYTEGPAVAAGETERRGRLLPGYDADLVAWDRDPLAVERDELREMRCVLTMVGGEVVWRDRGSD